MYRTVCGEQCNAKTLQHFCYSPKVHYILQGSEEFNDDGLETVLQVVGYVKRRKLHHAQHHAPGMLLVEDDD